MFILILSFLFIFSFKLCQNQATVQTNWSYLATLFFFLCGFCSIHGEWKKKRNDMKCVMRLKMPQYILQCGGNKNNNHLTQFTDDNIKSPPPNLTGETKSILSHKSLHCGVCCSFLFLCLIDRTIMKNVFNIIWWYANLRKSINLRQWYFGGWRFELKAHIYHLQTPRLVHFTKCLELRCSHGSRTNHY